VLPNGTLEVAPTQSFTTPSFGVSYRLNDRFTFYLTHSEGIFPNAGQRDGNYNEIDAEKSINDEIGVKFDLMDGKLSGTLSFFKIKRENATYRLAVAPNPAGWFGGPAHSGENTSVAFDPNIFAGTNGVPADAEPSRADWPTKFEQTVTYEGRRPPADIGRVPVNMYGLVDENLEKSLAEFDLTIADVVSNRHPTTGEKFTNPPSGFVAEHNSGCCQGDFFNQMITLVYYFDPEVIEAGPHSDPEIERLRQAVRAAYVDAYSGQDERQPDFIRYAVADFRIGLIQNPSQYGQQSNGTPGGTESFYVTYEEEGKGFDGQIIFSPSHNYQVMFNFSHIERQIVGRGFNMVRPIDQYGNDWATGYDSWNWAFGRQNFTDPKDPTTFTGEGVNGIDISFVPQNNLSLWNKYQFTEGKLKNFDLFGGVTWKDGAVTSVPIGGQKIRANFFRTPPTAERYNVQAGFGYQWATDKADWRLRVNVNNLLDDTYDSNVITYNETDPLSGAAFTEQRRWEQYFNGRSYRLSLNASF